MNWSVRVLVVALALLGAVPAHAVQVGEILPDPVLEARARDISHDLRCMVCQNQSIDDSEAPLTRDLRERETRRSDALRRGGCHRASGTCR